MARSTVHKAATLTPADWPDWVMSFPEPWISPDPVKQAARMRRFHLWRRDRDAWLLKAGSRGWLSTASTSAGQRPGRRLTRRIAGHTRRLDGGGRRSLPCPGVRGQS